MDSPTDPDLDGRILLREVRFAVEEREILKGISAEIAPGEILCVMGLSGSGKSTLLKLIAGLSRTTSGEILIDNEDITRMSERQLDEVRAKMGVVFQYAALFV